MTSGPVNISDDFGDAGKTVLQNVQDAIPGVMNTFNSAAGGVWDFMKAHPGVAKWASFGMAFMMFLGPGQDILKRIPGVGDLYNKFSNIPILGSLGSLAAAVAIGSYASSMFTNKVLEDRNAEVAQRDFVTGRAYATPPGTNGPNPNGGVG